MSRTDVVVVGAGLAGPVRRARPDAGGAHVTVLEARDRVGGRVEQVELPDGRRVQLGGEVVGNAHTAYLGLVEELGLTLVPSYVAEPGEITRQVPGARSTSATGRRGARRPTSPPTRRRGRAREGGGQYRPGRPVRLPRPAPARPAQRRRLPARERRHPGRAAAMGAGPPEPLGRLDRAHQHVRLRAQDRRRWRHRGLRRRAVGEPAGRRGVGHGGAEDGGGAVRRTPRRRRSRRSTSARGLRSSPRRRARRSRADAVVLAVPSGPARDIDITGVSDERLASLRRQRHAWAAKFVAAYDAPFWRDTGQNALAESEGVLGLHVAAAEGVLSALVPPERYAAFVASDPDTRTREALAQIAGMYGDRGAVAAADLDPALGHRPVDPGLRHQLAAGRRRGGRPAARHARAAVLRVRLRPVGGRLHGGRRPHRPGRRRSSTGG